MVSKKKIRKRGKIQFSRYFQNFKKGDHISVVKEVSIASSFPARLQGRTGEVLERQGRSYIVEIKDSGNKKRFIIEPVHLKKINISNPKQK